MKHFQVIEDLIKYTTKQLLESCPDDIEFIVKSARKEGQKEVGLFTVLLDELPQLHVILDRARMLK
jgi:aspartyl/asparaginyl-tRNA synthetase